MSYIPEIFLSHTVTCYLCHVDVVMLLADMVHHRTKCHLIWTLSTVHCLVVVQRCLSSAMLCFFLICIYHDAVYWTSWLTLMYTITFALCSEFVWKSAKCYWLLSWHSLLKWLLHAVCVCLCRALTFVYPYGATLNVAKPAIAVLSSGSVSYPLNRPVCAFYGLKVSDDVSHLCQLLMSDPLTCLVVIVSMLCVDRVAEESWPCWDHVICSVISISTRKKTAKYS